MEKDMKEIKITSGSDLLAYPRLSLRILNILLVTLIIAFLTWANLSTVEQATRAEGYVIPAGKVQLVQNLEGGIIDTIHVSDGDAVKAGEPLVQISSAKIIANLNEAKEKIVGYQAELARLQAERDDEAPQFDTFLLANYPDVVNGQIALLKSNRKSAAAFIDEQNSEITQRKYEIAEWQSKQESALKRLELAKREHKIIDELVARGAAPTMELITLERQITEIKETIETAKNSIPRLKAAIKKHENTKTRELEQRHGEVLDQLNRTQVELSALQEAIKGNEDQLERTVVKAPVSGTIKTIHVNTVGQVISPGMDIAEIIPGEDSLLIEGKILPQDIAFLRPDLEANIRMTAYDFSIYGSMKGKLESISADSIEDDQGNRFYHVKVRADGSSLQRDGKVLPIIPGMTAEINIVTGERTILEYILKPVIKTVSNSLHER